MSVHKGLRGPSHLDAQAKTEELVAHTIKILCNPNVFDPKYQALVDRVMDCAIGIGQDMWEANGIRVGDSPRKWAMRRDLQERACRGFDTLLYLIKICKPVFGLRNGKVYYWTKLTTDARDLARKWRDSDARRNGHLESGT